MVLEPKLLSCSESRLHTQSPGRYIHPLMPFSPLQPPTVPESQNPEPKLLFDKTDLDYWNSFQTPHVFIFLFPRPCVKGLTLEQSVFPPSVLWEELLDTQNGQNLWLQTSRAGCFVDIHNNLES